MTLSQKIVVAVDRQGPIASGPIPITVEHGPHRLLIELTQAGPVGLALQSLSYRNLDHAQRSLADLQAWGEKLASKVTYLMEPLKVLEIDQTAQLVELRSAKPTRRGDATSFHQIQLAHDGECRLARFAFSASDRRRHPVECLLTREAFELLVDDLVESSSSSSFVVAAQ